MTTGTHSEHVVSCPSIDWTNTGWKMDPVLELWIDVETSPVTVRLAGVLDRRTCRNVEKVIEELLEEGYRHLQMLIDELDVPDAAGLFALVNIERLVRRSEGEMTWSC